MKAIYALGVGRATPIFIELAESCGYRVVGLYHYDDSRTGEMDHGFPILGSFDDLFNSDVGGRNFVLTMGNMKIKLLETKLQSLYFNLCTLIFTLSILKINVKFI